MLRGYTEPMPHPCGTQSVIVGASCWLFAAAAAAVGSPWLGAWVVVSAVSFAADYVARDSWWAVLDRYVATAAAVAVVPTAPPALLCVAAAAAAASRLSASTRQWIVAHTLWHVAAAVVVAAAAPRRSR